MMTVSLYTCGHCGKPQVVGSPCPCWVLANELTSIEKLGIAVSDFIGKHNLMWSDELVLAWQEAEADYVDEINRALNQGKQNENT
tara:strand:- start:402 stop:656 length:255 start_codon:yes stop_codon:yes gene_type:complete